MSEFIKAAVIGHPIGHSKSPLIHNHWISKYGLQGSYEAIDIAPENLTHELQKLIDNGYTGFNFTIPHKQAAIELCDELDSSAEITGAVNCMSMEKGKKIGRNTDSYGFLANITHHIPGFEFDLGPALVLGAGGAGRAIVSGLMAARVPEIILTNRTREKADKLAAEMDMHTGLIRVVDWEEKEKYMSLANMLINTTSLGMKGQPPLEINLDKLAKFALVNDIVYAPLYTPLLQEAKERGNKIVTGIGMLLYQAQPAFKSWFHVNPEVDEELMQKVLSA